MKNLRKKIGLFLITIAKKACDIFKRREIGAVTNRDTGGVIEEIATGQKTSTTSAAIGDNATDKGNNVYCPYCSSQNTVKRGLRQKKLETVQLYLCRTCNRTFTPGSTKGKHYPLEIILDAVSLYNIGYGLEEAAGIANKIHKGSIVGSSLKNWVEQYKPLCSYSRMRPFGTKIFGPKDTIISATLAHRQLYRYRYHQAKTRLIIEEDFKHSKFWPLKEFLELVPAECPHQYFQQGLRASEAPMTFSKKEMIVRSKQNYANKIAKFVLESVGQNKDRHDALQRFMIANDSVTVATEVPIYIRNTDLAHMQTQLGFEMYRKKERNQKELTPFSTADLPHLITGHIDFIQIRNGMAHILDYKPNAAKERPLEQLTLYALALSRLTGLRVYFFKCAWFDEKNYFEFYPLHLVYKPKGFSGRRKPKQKISTKEGVYDINNDEGRVESLEPAGTRGTLN